MRFGCFWMIGTLSLISVTCAGCSNKPVAVLPVADVTQGYVVPSYLPAVQEVPQQAPAVQSVPQAPAGQAPVQTVQAYVKPAVYVKGDVVQAYLDDREIAQRKYEGNQVDITAIPESVRGTTVVVYLQAPVGQKVGQRTNVKNAGTGQLVKCKVVCQMDNQDTLDQLLIDNTRIQVKGIVDHWDARTRTLHMKDCNITALHYVNGEAWRNKKK